MRFKTTGTVLLGAAALAASAVAQTTPALPPITRTVVAATKLPVTDMHMPLHFRAVGVTIPAGGTSSVSTADGVLYQMSGSTEVSIGGNAKTLGAGEGIFITAGTTASLKAGTAEPSIFLHFLLTQAAGLDQSAETAPATVKELYRTATAIPDLKPGTFDRKRRSQPTAGT